MIRQIEGMHELHAFDVANERVLIMTSYFYFFDRLLPIKPRHAYHGPNPFPVNEAEKTGERNK